MKFHNSIALLTLIVSAAYNAEAKPHVFPGAIITERQGAHPTARAATKSDSPTSNSDIKKSFSTRTLSSSAILIKEWKIGTGVRSASTARVYSRANDLCRRAKVRTFIKNSRKRLLCEQNWEVKRLATTPNDTYFPNLHGLNQNNDIDINGPEAWDITTGSSNIVVGVVDTGIDYNHNDLAANILVNTGEIPGNGIDDDNNGYVDDVYGYDFVNNEGNPMDDHFHGTHCAGTIGAMGNNGRGVVGVNWNVKIIAAKFLGSDGSGSLSGAVSSINYLTNRAAVLASQGKRMIATNNSWGGGGYSVALYNAIAAARDAGILFIAAAGNETNNNDASPSYPASYNLSNVIAVAALDANGALASFSNYGATSVHVGAPGVNIRSTYPGNQYADLSGTSMAAPHVTGMAALLAAHRPNATMSQIKEAILTTVRPRASIASLTVTGGEIDLYAGLLKIATLVPENSMTPTPAPTVTPVETVPPTATPLPGVTATPVPTATRTPDPIVTVPPDPTVIPTAIPSVSVTSPESISPNASFRITIGAARVAPAKIRFELDGKTCPVYYTYTPTRRDRMPFTFAFKLGRTASKFASLKVIATVDRQNATSESAVRGGRPDRNYRAYLASACPRL